MCNTAMQSGQGNYLANLGLYPREMYLYESVCDASRGGEKVTWLMALPICYHVAFLVYQI
jgi:hypothetical protein